MPTYILKNNEHFLVEGIEQVRALSPWRHVPRLIKGFVLISATVLGAVLWWPDEPALIGFLIAFVGLVSFLPGKPHRNRIHDLRRSPDYNAEINVGLSEGSFQSRLPGTTIDQDWRFLIRVVRRPTGFLLYSKTGITWLPDSALVEGSREDVELILREKAGSFAAK